MPAIFGGVSQNGARLSTREVKRLTKVIGKFQRRFPQSRLHLLCRSFSQDIDFKAILFWLFNKAGLSNQGNRGGQKRDVVFLIESAGGELAKGEFAVAFEMMVDELSQEMQKVCGALPEAVGLQAQTFENKTPSY